MSNVSNCSIDWNKQNLSKIKLNSCKINPKRAQIWIAFTLHQIPNHTKTWSRKSNKIYFTHFYFDIIPLFTCLNHYTTSFPVDVGELVCVCCLFTRRKPCGDASCGTSTKWMKKNKWINNKQSVCRAAWKVARWMNDDNK